MKSNFNNITSLDLIRRLFIKFRYRFFRVNFFFVFIIIIFISRRRLSKIIRDSNPFSLNSSYLGE